MLRRVIYIRGVRRFLEDRSFDYRSVNCFERKNEGFVFHATLVDALREMRP